MLAQGGNANLPRTSERRVHSVSGREFVLFADTFENTNVAPNLDALLEQQIPHERLGKGPKKLDQPVHKVHLWNSTGIQNDTSDFREQATGIVLYTCGALFLSLQVSFCTPLLLSHPLPPKPQHGVQQA